MRILATLIFLFFAAMALTLLVQLLLDKNYTILEYMPGNLCAGVVIANCHSGVRKLWGKP